jgi:hypothetical protein
VTECGDFIAALKRGEPSSSPELAAHTASCEVCRDLAGSPSLGNRLAALDPPALPVSFDAIAAAISRERGPVAWLRSRPAATRFVLAVLVAATTAIAVLAAGHGPRRDLSLYPLPRLVLALGLLGGVSLGSIWLVFRPLQLAPLTRASVFVLIAGFAVRLALALLPRTHPADPDALAVHGPNALECFTSGAVMGLPLVAFALAASRMPTLTTRLLAASAAGLLGNLVLELGCPSTDPTHLLEGHAPIVPALVSLAYVISKGVAR